MKKLILPACILLAMACNQPTKNEGTNEDKGYTPVFSDPEFKLESDIMSPEILWSFGRIGGVSVSPNGKSIVYPVTFFDKEKDRGFTDLYVQNIREGKARRITHTSANESSPVWTPDGKHIAYISEGQLYEITPDGANVRAVTKVKGGIRGFLYAPDMTKILLLKEVKLEKDVQDLHPDLPKATGRLIGSQFYRHWDHWVETYTHPFVADYHPGIVISSPGKDIMEGEKWESPVRPFGGVEQLTWTKDSKSIIYTSRKKEGIEYARSTNSDLYKYDLTNGKTQNLTEGMMGYDNNPVISPNGKLLAWGSMERDGYEADKIRIFIMELATGRKKDYSMNFDQNAEGIVWGNDTTLYFISDHKATDEIYRLDLNSGKIKKVTEGIHNYTSVQVADNGLLIATKQSMSRPTEIFRVDPETGNDTEISFVNKNLLSQLTMGKVEKHWVNTSDKKEMLTWIVLPPHFDPNKKYPALLFCEGGPQSTVSQFWSYRWNFQMMAAKGYVVVAPNRRGLPGFGKEWLEQISGDYSGQNIKDYLSAIDYAAKLSYVDPENLGCVGASYGGYSVYYLAGHHEKRFKAFIAHDGMFDLNAQYYETEEMWFVDWDLGGAPWDKKNKTAQRSYANSPDKFVDKWDTPILVIHGQEDFRIDASQGMSAFNAARMRGIPAEYLYFPDENHWVLKCQNGILWQRTFFAWLDKWLKTNQ